MRNPNDCRYCEGWRCARCTDKGIGEQADPEFDELIALRRQVQDLTAELAEFNRAPAKPATTQELEVDRLRSEVDRLQAETNHYQEERHKWLAERDTAIAKAAERGAISWVGFILQCLNERAEIEHWGNVMCGLAMDISIQTAANEGLCMCAFCGQKSIRKGAGMAHAAVCEKHPLPAVIRERDGLKASLDFTRDQLKDTVEALCRVRDAERERCAAIARSMPDGLWQHGEKIALAILAQGDA